MHIKKSSLKWLAELNRLDEQKWYSNKVTCPKIHMNELWHKLQENEAEYFPVRINIPLSKTQYAHK